MPLKKALLIALLLVVPGVVFRVAPYVDRIAGAPRRVVPAAPQGDTAPAARVPSRLSQRPLIFLVLGLGVEAALHAGLIVILLRSATLVALFGSLPRSARASMVLFFVVLVTGFLGGGDRTYPFVAWRMYSGRPSHDPGVCLIDGETRTGAVVRLNIEELMPAIGPRRLYHILDRLSTPGNAEGGGAESQAHLRATLLGLGRLYNSQHADDPLVRMRLFVATVPLEATAPPWLRDRREVVAVEIDPA
jgi:hypothetical protein